MANAQKWYRSGLGILIAAFLLPPLGAILLWIRPRTRLFFKVLGTAGIAILAVVHLVVLFEMRVELAGSGSMPVIYFGTAESNLAKLQRQRSEQKEAAEVPTLTVDGEVGASWPRFRGPADDGIYFGGPISLDWPLPELWKQPVGGGYSGFVIAGGQAITLEQRGTREVVASYASRSGVEIWTHSWEALFQESMGGDGPRGTPTLDLGKVYALGATGELRALNAVDGELVWRVNILEDNGASNLQWGVSSSPLVVDDLLIVLPGGPSGRSVVAYDKDSGEMVWAAQDDVQSYSSPMLATLAGERQLLVAAAKRVMGLSVEDGGLLWDYPWETAYDVNAAQPILVDDESFLISSGYDHGAALVAVKAEGEGFEAETVWFERMLKTRFNNSVLFDGFVYGLDAGILTCIDVASGKRQWKGGRYGYGQLVLAGEHLIVITEKGELALVEARPEKRVEVAKFNAISGKTWNHLAIGDGVLLVRNAREAAAYDLALEP